MDNTQIFFLALFTSGLIIVQYRRWALPRGWSIGSLFASETGFLQLIGKLSIFIGTLASFFFIEWYLVIALVIAANIISLIVLITFKSMSQLISLIMLVFSWSILLI